MPEIPESTQGPSSTPEETSPEKVTGILGLEMAIHQEVEAFFENIRKNVSTHLETPLHNYIHAEKEALKARISALIHKED